MIEKKMTLAKWMIGTIMVVIALAAFIPIINMFARAFSAPDKVYLLRGYDILPKGFSIVHFQVVFDNPLVVRSLLNSIFITTAGTLISLFLTTMTAYVLTRKNLIGKTPLMILLIIFMIFEPGLIQEYMLIKDLHLLDSLWSMVCYRMINVFYLIIMMRFLEEVPDSLVDAARIDGASHMKLFLRIVLPLIRIPLLTIGMFYAVSKWNEFFRSSIFLSSPNKTVLQVLLRQFVVEQDSSSFMGSTNMLLNNSIGQLDISALKAATIVVAMVPILMLYPIILKYYTKGVLDGGIKE